VNLRMKWRTVTAGPAPSRSGLTVARGKYIVTYILRTMRHRPLAPYRRRDRLGPWPAGGNGAGFRARLTVWIRPPEPTVPGGRAGWRSLWFR